MPLQIVKPRISQGPLSINELLGLLHPDHYDAIDRDVRQMRQSYYCPAVVRDYEEFKDVLHSYYKHYQKAVFDIDEDAATHDEHHRKIMREYAYREIAERLLGAYQGDLRTAERNAIMGRDGGMIRVIDAMTEGITKFLTENYIRAVFMDAISPSDYNTRFRLAEELIKRFGPVLFPHEELLHPAILGHDLEKLMNGFVQHLHSLRRAWRY